MRKRVLSVLIGLTLVLTMVFGLLPACGGGGEQTPGPGASVAPGEVLNWRYQSNTNAGTATYWTEEEFAAVMKKATGGRINIDVQPQGAIVGSMEIFDAVSTGAIETGSS